MKSSRGEAVRRGILTSLAALALGSSACSRVTSVEPVAPAPEVTWLEDGVASWYGEPFHGRRTASGEVYDMEAMTAAHRTLPFGTLLQVRNLDNGRGLRVRVNDRGPFVQGRILDLSRRAARELNMIGPGVARVRLFVVGAPPHPGGRSCWLVQAALYTDPDIARSHLRELEQAEHRAWISSGPGELHRVRVGPFRSLGAAEDVLGEMEGATLLSCGIPSI